MIHLRILESIIGYPIIRSSNYNVRSFTTSKDCSTKERDVIIEARTVLSQMLASLAPEHPVRKFLILHCKHLLIPGYVYPGTLNSSTAEALTVHPVKGSKGLSHPSTYTSIAGVYLFESLVTGAQYIGSAICLNTRFKSHITNSTRPSRGGNNHFYRYIMANGG